MNNDTPKKKDNSVTRDLTEMSLHELADYKSELEGEIIRVDLEVEKKENDKNSAESVFSKKD